MLPENIDYLNTFNLLNQISNDFTNFAYALYLFDAFLYTLTDKRLRIYRNFYFLSVLQTTFMQKCTDRYAELSFLLVRIRAA